MVNPHLSSNTGDSLEALAGLGKHCLLWNGHVAKAFSVCFFRLFLRCCQMAFPSLHPSKFHCSALYRPNTEIVSVTCRGAALSDTQKMIFIVLYPDSTIPCNYEEK